MTVHGRLRALARDRRGATTILTAGMAASAVTALAFAVDVGALYMDSRRMQGIVDAAALAAAGDLAHADAAARGAIAANGLSGAYQLTIEPGAYHADPAIAPAARFDGASATRDAARVTLSHETQLYFGVAALGRSSVRVARTATATRRDLAAFSIGSRLAALDGGIANALLSGLTGSKVSLSAMDYDALLGAEVDLLAFADALRVETDLTAASFDRALDAHVAPPRALAVLAAALDRGGTGAAAAAVRKIAAAGVAGDAHALSRLIDLGPIGAQDRAASGQAIRVSAFDLARGMLELAGGARQVKLDLAASVPGLTAVTAHLAIGERPAGSPWVAVTPTGEPIVRTAQTRLFVDAAVLPGGLAALGVAAVRLPLYVELAEAEAKLARVSCNPRAGTRTAALDVRPAIGHASIADVAPTTLGNHRVAPVEAPARIVAAPLVSVSGSARVNLSSGPWQRIEFTADQVAARTPRTVQASGTVQGLAGSLLRTLALDVNVLGIGLGVNAVGGLVGAALEPAAPAVDRLLESLTGLLGIHLGEADVRIDGVRCGQAALVG